MMKRVCKKLPKAFRIAFFNSLGTYLLPQVFELFLQAHPQITISIMTHLQQFLDSGTSWSIVPVCAKF